MIAVSDSPEDQPASFASTVAPSRTQVRGTCFVSSLGNPGAERCRQPKVPQGCHFCAALIKFVPHRNASADRAFRFRSERIFLKRIFLKCAVLQASLVP